MTVTYPVTYCLVEIIATSLSWHSGIRLVCHCIRYVDTYLHPFVASTSWSYVPGETEETQMSLALVFCRMLDCICIGDVCFLYVALLDFM